MKPSLLQRQQLLVVNDPGTLAQFVRGRYPQFDVNVSPSPLAGIASLAQVHDPRGVLIGVEASSRKIDKAVAGLRKAAGNKVKLVLCCSPSGEPTARQALSAGADDYVIYPPSGDELDRALAMPAAKEQKLATDLIMPIPSYEELTTLCNVLSNLEGNYRDVLERLCVMVSQGLRTDDVRIVTDVDVVCIGDPEVEPALAEQIMSHGRNMGRVEIGSRHHHPFNAADGQRLEHYGRLIGHLLGVLEREQQWQSLAMIDSVSQLPNRRCLMEQLDSLLRRAGKEQFRITILIFDLDGFKHFNDTYGHSAGDEIIRETGQLFQHHCRQHDIVARYAGDEFVVVFWDAEEPRVAGSKHPISALAVLRRFKAALQQHPFAKLGPEAIGSITISGGLASYPWDGRTAEELIDKADQALLQAKRDGKNRIYLVGAEGTPIDAAD